MKNNLSVVFVSNFFNHHQRPFSDAMFARLGSNYTFIETGIMTQERKALGWGVKNLPPYVVSREALCSHRNVYEKLIDEADVVIFGSAPYALVARRIKADKLTFRYSERPLKKGLELWKYLPRLIRWHRRNPQNKRLYLLCASAYAAGDYAKFFLYRNKSYKWGYFPETRRYEDIDALIEGKSQNSLIWVARYIELKHPEVAVMLCKRLKEAGYSFEMKMIGNGPLQEETAALVKKEGLEDVVRVLGAMTPEQVRQHMEQSQIHVFTSDRNEGWGAVLNESMNSACVPVAHRVIGSVPYLIGQGENGFAYATVDELYEKVKYLLDHPEARIKMAKEAYRAIVERWNAETAADRLLALSQELLSGQQVTARTLSGPCERA